MRPVRVLRGASAPVVVLAAVALVAALCAAATTSPVRADVRVSAGAAAAAPTGLTVVDHAVDPGGGLFASWNEWTVAADGTLWFARGSSSGTTIRFDHYARDEGDADYSLTDLGDGFTVARNNPTVQSLAVTLGRVYVTADGAKLMTWNTDGGDFVLADGATTQRTGQNQARLRATPAGGLLALGQTNKVAAVSLGELQQVHPFYPQTWHGAGINQTNPPANTFQSCVLSVDGPDVVGDPATGCGTGQGLGSGGGSSPSAQALDYAQDVAGGDSLLYVLESGSSQVTTIDLTGPRIAGVFAGPGTGSGDLSTPQSMVRDPGTGHLFISDPGTSRINEFDSAGGFVAGYGFGVDGGDGSTLEACTTRCVVPSTSAGQAAGAWYRLELVGDRLYASNASTGRIDVLALGGGGPVPATTVALSADPTRVRKGRPTTLTARVKPAGTCAGRVVLFQRKTSQSWANLGRTVAVDDRCRATRRQKVSSDSRFRALAIDPATQATLATSETVTVKVRKP